MTLIGISPFALFHFPISGYDDMISILERLPSVKGERDEMSGAGMGERHPFPRR
jgi:hypothetical protein